MMWSYQDTNCEFHLLDAAEAADRVRWLEYWHRWDGREVFAHPDYLLLYIQPHHRALCALMTGEDGIVLYPFIWRDLAVEPYWDARISHGADLTSPYGYGGPFCWMVTNRDALNKKFWEIFAQWAQQTNVVSEFIRFTLFPETHLYYPGNFISRQQNVVRSLTPSVDNLWMDFRHKVRKNVKRAQENNVQIELDTTGIRLADFLKIYYDTMRRREASKRYFFSEDYFERIHHQLPGQFVYLHALFEGQVISTELVLVSERQVYSFLGGTNDIYLEYRPNDLLKYHIMLWAKEQGKQYFVLGGGYQGNDGIFKYKLAFAPEGQRSFYIGTRVWMPQLYDQLVERKRQTHPSANIDPSFFPAYRA